MCAYDVTPESLMCFVEIYSACPYSCGPSAFPRKRRAGVHGEAAEDYSRSEEDLGALAGSEAGRISGVRADFASGSGETPLLGPSGRTSQ